MLGTCAGVACWHQMLASHDGITCLQNMPCLAVFLQESAFRITELEANNNRVLQELAEFKAESKELRNQDLTIKRMEAQLGQLKAQLQNKVGLLPTVIVLSLSHTGAMLAYIATLSWLRLPRVLCPGSHMLFPLFDMFCVLHMSSMNAARLCNAWHSAKQGLTRGNDEGSGCIAICHLLACIASTHTP